MIEIKRRRRAESARGVSEVSVHRKAKFTRWMSVRTRCPQPPPLARARSSLIRCRRAEASGVSISPPPHAMDLPNRNASSRRPKPSRSTSRSAFCSAMPRKGTSPRWYAKPSTIMSIARSVPKIFRAGVAKSTKVNCVCWARSSCTAGTNSPQGRSVPSPRKAPPLTMARVRSEEAMLSKTPRAASAPSTPNRRSASPSGILGLKPSSVVAVEITIWVEARQPGPQAVDS